MRHLQRGTHFAPLALLLGLTLALGACDKTSSTELAGDGNGLARISILLTDAPGEVAEAWVKFDAIYLQRQDDDGNAGMGSGRVFLLENPTDWINLKDLTAGEVEQLVSGVTVPDGFYGQLRFVITRAVLATGDGMTIDNAYATPDVDSDDLAELNALRDPAPPLDPTDELKCPSCSRSGLKLNFRDGGLEVTGETLVLADFDVSQSFGHQAGMSGRWIMHPVINAMVMGGGTGSIAGTVSTDPGVNLPASCGGQTITLAHFEPTAESGGMTWTGAVDETDGSYEIANLPPSDDYVLDFTPEFTFANNDKLTFNADILDASDTPITGPVEVMDGMTFIANYVITAADCIVP